MTETVKLKKKINLELITVFRTRGTWEKMCSFLSDKLHNNISLFVARALSQEIHMKHIDDLINELKKHRQKKP